MPQVKDIMRSIAEHVFKTIDELDEKEVETMVAEIIKAKRVFVMGAGRSGLAAKAFAMRLSQMNLVVYVVGETVTPGMGKDDLFVIVSGSGETLSAVSAAKVAGDIGVRIVAITSYPGSSLGKLADNLVVVKGKTKADIEKDHLKHQIQGVHSSLTPLGTLFEDTVIVFLDGVVGRLMEVLGKQEFELKDRHANF